ncbi:hypothetical protein [Nocardia aurantia]|uniref:hypothetical protein n=1 Tax=Nocardia aurantia TaxID=2585199 RepID=UPI001296B7AB|nr:hypothetical protein [Nocardia aurantia]
MPRRVFGILFGADRATKPTTIPADAGYPLGQRVLALLLGVTLPNLADTDKWPDPALSPNNTPRPPKQDPWFWVGRIGLVLAAAAIVGAMVVFGGVRSRSPIAEPTTVPASFPPAPSNCSDAKQDSVTTGNGPGDVTSDTGAILGYQYAYYTERDAVAALTFVTPEARKSLSANRIQDDIDHAIPPGTVHCVRIQQIRDNVYVVATAEYHPDGATHVYSEQVRTVTVDGRHLIESVQITDPESSTYPMPPTLPPSPDPALPSESLSPTSSVAPGGQRATTIVPMPPSHPEHKSTADQTAPPTPVFPPVFGFPSLPAVPQPPTFPTFEFPSAPGFAPTSSAPEAGKIQPEN